MPEARRTRVTFRQLSGLIYLAEITIRYENEKAYQWVMTHEEKAWLQSRLPVHDQVLDRAVGCWMSRDTSRDASQM